MQRRKNFWSCLVVSMVIISLGKCGEVKDHGIGGSVAAAVTDHSIAGQIAAVGEVKSAGQQLSLIHISSAACAVIRIIRLKTRTAQAVRVFSLGGRNNVNLVKFTLTEKCLSTMIKDRQKA